MPTPALLISHDTRGDSLKSRHLNIKPYKHTQHILHTWRFLRLYLDDTIPTSTSYILCSDRRSLSHPRYHFIDCCTKKHTGHTCITPHFYYYLSYGQKLLCLGYSMGAWLERSTITPHRARSRTYFFCIPQALLAWNWAKGIMATIAKEQGGAWMTHYFQGEESHQRIYLFDSCQRYWISITAATWAG